MVLIIIMMANQAHDVMHLLILLHFYLPLADRPGTGDYKMPCVHASVHHVFTKAFLSL